ncbi:hypothetical protein [Cysteiniphilum litorale]|uniref:hypothetical protein n=1 Tax=Cysteiniphilum litorale TaxID=2056700 RepID=UPI003F883BC5
MIYAFFYLAFCIYLGFFLKSKWVALLLATSVISWFVVRLPEINADLSWRFALTIIAYITEFVVLLYFFPKKIIQLTRPNVQKNLIVAVVLLVVFSMVVLFSSLAIPYMQQVLMQQANADINHILSQISWLYRFGSFAGWLSFFSYLYLWVGLSRFIVKRPFGV